MKRTRKTISIILTIAFIAAGIFPAAAQKKKRSTRKTRDIAIYVYELPTEGEDFSWRLVPVRRTILDDKPLSRALKMFLKSVTEEERDRHLVAISYDFEFFSARIRNRTAQINFKLKYPEMIEEIWEGIGFKNEDFVKAVELTARQIPGVERISICVNGIENYANFASHPVKCSFGMFKTQQ
jgi:hypothetical protein